MCKDREDLAWEQSDKRSVPKLSYKRSHIFEQDSQYDKMWATKRQAQWNRGYYKTHYPLFAKIWSFGMHKQMLYPTENRPNFFKVLYQNLTNKENVPEPQKYDLRVNYKHLV